VFAVETGVVCKMTFARKTLNPVFKRETVPVNEREMEWLYTVNDITKTGKLIVPKQSKQDQTAGFLRPKGRQSHRRTGALAPTGGRPGNTRAVGRQSPGKLRTGA
jgi:hypothetical protein